MSISAYCGKSQPAGPSIGGAVYLLAALQSESLGRLLRGHAGECLRYPPFTLCSPHRPLGGRQPDPGHYRRPADSNHRFRGYSSRDDRSNSWIEIKRGE
jgi:hypothetical protein